MWWIDLGLGKCGNGFRAKVSVGDNFRVGVIAGKS